MPRMAPVASWFFVDLGIIIALDDGEDFPGAREGVLGGGYVCGGGANQQQRQRRGSHRRDQHQADRVIHDTGRLNMRSPPVAIGPRRAGKNCRRPRFAGRRRVFHASICARMWGVCSNPVAARLGIFAQKHHHFEGHRVVERAQVQPDGALHLFQAVDQRVAVDVQLARGFGQVEAVSRRFQWCGAFRR